jgi:hypothetical protein
MAVVGKFEFTQKTLCAACGQWQDLHLRSLDWTGELWNSVRCSTPECGQELIRENQHPRRCKGGVSGCRPVTLLTLPEADAVILEDYECSATDAERFCSIFSNVLYRIPMVARESIAAHWRTGHGSPHVWLLQNRRRWGGRGWAASTPSGLSFYMVSTLIGSIPQHFIETAIAHELGHMLFIAGREEHHALVVPTLKALFDPPAPDPLRRYRAEWLVWRLIESWGFDQLAMEEWMERNMIDDDRGIRLRDYQLSDADFQGQCFAVRNSIAEKLRDMIFPVEFEKYLRD